MGKETKDIDLEVAEAVNRIRSSGDKVTHRRVRAEVNRKASEVCNAFKRFRENERCEEEKRLSNAITPAIRSAILNDREEYVKAKTKILNNEIKQLEITCEVLNEEIERLQEGSDELEIRMASEGNAYNEKIRILEQSNSQVNGILQSTQEQVNFLQNELIVVKKHRNDTVKKCSGLSATLVQRSSEAKTEKTNSTRLLQELEKERAARKQVEFRTETAEKTSERLQGQVFELTGHLEQLRKDLSTEIQLRIEAEKQSAGAIARAETLQMELTAAMTKLQAAILMQEKATSDSKTQYREQDYDEGLGF